MESMGSAAMKSIQTQHMHVADELRYCLRVTQRPDRMVSVFEVTELNAPT